MKDKTPSESAPVSIPPAAVVFDPIPEGFRVRLGDRQLAVITTKHHLNETNQGDHQLGAEDIAKIRCGAVVWVPMKRSDWSIHFCSPTMSLQELEGIAGLLPLN